MRKCLLLIALVICIVGCAPSRWDHVDIEQINGDGEVVAMWEDARILATGPGFLSGGNNWVRFKTNDGREISLVCPHRFIYR